MLVVMKAHATEEQVRAVCERIESLGFKAHPIPGSIRTAIGDYPGALALVDSIRGLAGDVDHEAITVAIRIKPEDVPKP